MEWMDGRLTFVELPSSELQKQNDAIVSDRSGTILRSSAACTRPDVPISHHGYSTCGLKVKRLFIYFPKIWQDPLLRHAKHYVGEDRNNMAESHIKGGFRTVLVRNLRRTRTIARIVRTGCQNDYSRRRRQYAGSPQYKLHKGRASELRRVPYRRTGCWP